MKKIILVIALAIGSLSYGQNCTITGAENISTAKVLSAYESWKSIFEIKKKGHDMMLFLINGSTQGELQQLYINTWHSIEKSVGKEELYKRFVSRYGYIDKTKYMNNIYCLEILSWYNQIIKNNS